MTTDVRDMLQDIAEAAPCRPDAWARNARSRAAQRRRRQRVVGAWTAVGTAAVVAVTAGATWPFSDRSSLPGAPYVIEDPGRSLPSVLDQPIAAAAALAVDGTRMFLVDAAGDGERSLPDHVGGHEVPDEVDAGCLPALSQDGSRLAWADCNVDHPVVTSLSVLTLSTGDVQRVPVTGPEFRSDVGGTANLSLVWSPDGTAIALLNANVAAVVELTDGRLTPVSEGFAMQAVWSPDSRRIAVFDNVLAPGAIGAGVFSRDLRTKVNVQALVPRQEVGGTWVWGPDGDTLSTSVLHDGKAEIILVPADGRGRVRRIELKGELAYSTGKVPSLRGWRGGRPVMHVFPPIEKRSPGGWVTYDPAAGQVEPLLAVENDVWVAQIPTDILADQPLGTVQARPTPAAS
ncbi:TolB-like translocation protein [Motilibacter deserti]|uniref:WD40 repeat protein n=1 Tax=Motilibacter deserti TaxID=2714956 RepID=A0ABX0H0Z2_9ACTN|nr:hypothetical protein [Motilibacter deserti]NHC15452.1 hypothetical protein [Motilibacter deserti]